MALFLEDPFLALAPATFFLCLFFLSKSRVVLGAAVTWLAYSFYEHAMKYRVLCSGECDIRIDLLMIYPALAVISLSAIAIFIRRLGAARRTIRILVQMRAGSFRRHPSGSPSHHERETILPTREIHCRLPHPAPCAIGRSYSTLIQKG